MVTVNGREYDGDERVGLRTNSHVDVVMHRLGELDLRRLRCAPRLSPDHTPSALTHAWNHYERPTPCGRCFPKAPAEVVEPAQDRIGPYNSGEKA